MNSDHRTREYPPPSWVEPGTQETARRLGESPPAHLLVVDDDDIVRETIGEALRESGYDVTVAASGEEALEKVRHHDYQLVLTDLVMPGISGIELCSNLMKMFPDLPVVLITGHGSVEVARESLDFGAADFVSKPINFSELPIVVERNLQRHRLQAKRVVEQSTAVLLQAVEALVQALDERDNSTAEHSQRVANMAVVIGQAMGLEEERLYVLRLAALLHDVGKIGIRDHILLKEGHLSTDEDDLMRQHPVKGAEILSRISHLDEVVSAILHHHEDYAGTGYPNGLKGEAIPIFSRIIRVVDSWDAMTMDRPYRLGLPRDVARGLILEASGKAFDPRIVLLFQQHVLEES